MTQEIASCVIKSAPLRMSARVQKKHVTNDRAWRENVPEHILFYISVSVYTGAIHGTEPGGIY